VLVDVLLHRPVYVVYLSHFLSYLAPLLIPDLCVLLFLCNFFRLAFLLDGLLLLANWSPSNLRGIFTNLLKNTSFWLFALSLDIEVNISLSVFIYFFKSRLFPEARGSRVTIEKRFICDGRRTSSDFQFILSQVEDSNEFVVLHFGFASNVPVLRIEDGLPVSSI
jgi:hypothetical protein